MKNLHHITTTMNISTQDKLNSLNAALMQVDDRLIHHMWCSGELPFMTPLAEFNTGDEPVVSWTLRCPDEGFIGQIELHNNRFGWILARLWIKKDWRGCGLARTLWSTAVDHAFDHADVVGAFCDDRNEASLNLQTSMAFKPTKRWVEQKCVLLTANKEDYEIYKQTVKPLLMLQKPAPTPCANPLLSALSNPATP